MRLNATREQFLAALRSGNYPQTQGVLVRNPGTENECFCAEGVLCEISTNAKRHPSGAGKRYIAYLVGTGEGSMEVNGCLTIYHPTRPEWLGDIRLYCLNDGNMTFEQIADFVEANTQ